MCAAAPASGTLELLEIVDQRVPVPARASAARGVHDRRARTASRLGCDPTGPLLAEVVKTTSDPYVGRVSLVRVFSGTIRPDATVHVSGHFASFYGMAADRGGHEDHDEDERIGTLSFPLGKQQRPAGTVVAGDICAIGQVVAAPKPETPCRDKADPLVLKPWTMPEPLLPIAIAAARQDRRRQTVGRACSGWRPKTRRCGSSRTRRPIKWCCGAWARHTRASCSTGWRTGTA